MTSTPNLPEYFARIGYAGPRTPTLRTLSDIHFRHPQAIAFENLDALLKRPIALSLEAFEQKLVRGGRGGWCYEQNLLLCEVLRALGFRVTGLAARVIWNAPEGAHRPRTHMLLRIDALDGGPYIVDVGFGGLTMTAPLRLVADVEQTTPHETFRLLEHDGGFMLQAWIRTQWQALYNFDLQPQQMVDYELWNWYLCNHPESPFLLNLMLARVTPERRYGLLNNKLSTHSMQGESEQTTLATPAELRRTVQDTFGVQLPDDPGMEALLSRFTLNTRSG